VAAGEFERANDEQIVAEEKLLIENLNVTSQLVSDHITNLLQEIEGKLPDDKAKMLEVIQRFQSLAPELRQNFIIGRRAGLYGELDDMDNPARRQAVDRLIAQIREEGHEPDANMVYAMMRGFI
jgi:hypothetical protein